MSELQAFSIYQGDTAPPLAATLELDGAPVDLSHATSVKVEFYRNTQDLTPVLSKEVADFNASGLVKYDWSSQDLNTLGRGIWYVRFRVVDSAGRINHYPDPLHAVPSRIVVE